MKAVFNMDEFKRIIKALKPFTGYVDLMTYIHFDVDAESKVIKFEALDGHRVWVENLDCEADESFSGYIKPMVINKTYRDSCEIEKVNNQVFLYLDDYRFTVMQPDADKEWYKTDKFLKDWEAEEAKIIIGVNAKLLGDALKYQYQAGLRGIVQIEARNPKSPLVIRNCKDKRNVRYILPVNL
jgi:DNA polymerase III sliding clamp (beta) subunit (PCNA family)